MTSKTMKLLPLLCLCLLTRSGTTFAAEQVIIFMKEGSDGVLPCSLSTKQNIEEERFEWKKDSQEVFIFDGGIVDENQQFKGRVSHFPDELQYGNASIIIRNTKVTDSGDYTCDFPNLQPSQTFNIQLVVVGPETITVEEDSDVILPCSLSSKENISSQVFDWRKDDQKEVFFYNGSTSSLSGAATKPSVNIIQTKDGMALQCVVLGSNIKPTVEWQDSAGNKLPAEEPQVSERGGSFYISLNTTVTKTDRYRCVATQEEIKHQIYTETYVEVNEPPKESSTGWVVPLLVFLFTLLAGCVILAVLVSKGCIKLTCNEGEGNTTQPRRLTQNLERRTNGPEPQQSSATTPLPLLYEDLYQSVSDQKERHYDIE